MLYITLLDQFHPGIYSSQVIDVCDYLNEKHNAKIRIVAFLSIKELRNTDAKLKLKQLSPNAIVLPAFPKLKYFQWTAILLFFVCLLIGERVAICRNVFCTKMALHLRKIGILKKVVFDGRSAMAAEISEYDVFPVNYLRNNVFEFEKYVVNQSDYLMAVSEKLVDYWKSNYNYTKSNHVVIPCTLDTKHFPEKTDQNWELLNETKKELGLNLNDVVLIYSGSNAPWQSFQLLNDFITKVFASQNNIKVILLTKETKEVTNLLDKFKGKVICKWVNEAEVSKYLKCADYGILLRNQSETNKVASPVKFAEYLYSGLKIIISENLGDYSQIVANKKCGFVINPNLENLPVFDPLTNSEKIYCHQLSLELFSKHSLVNTNFYKKLITFLTN